MKYFFAGWRYRWWDMNCKTSMFLILISLFLSEVEEKPVFAFVKGAEAWGEMENAFLIPLWSDQNRALKQVLMWKLKTHTKTPQYLHKRLNQYVQGATWQVRSGIPYWFTCYCKLHWKRYQTNLAIIFSSFLFVLCLGFFFLSRQAC